MVKLHLSCQDVNTFLRQVSAVGLLQITGGLRRWCSLWRSSDPICSKSATLASIMMKLLVTK